MKGGKIIRQLRMAIIHPYLCFGKKYCPRELALLITLSSVWNMSERRFCVHCWSFPAVFLSMIKKKCQAFNKPHLSEIAILVHMKQNYYRTKHMFLKHLYRIPFHGTTSDHHRSFEPQGTLGALVTLIILLKACEAQRGKTSFLRPHLEPWIRKLWVQPQCLQLFQVVN